MARQVKKTTSRKRYSKEFKGEALELARKAGVPAASRELGLLESQLYNWRMKARAEQDQSEVQQQLSVENARLKRQLAEQAEELAILKKAAAYFAKGLK